MNMQQDNGNSNVDINPSSGLSVGQSLREAREQFGLSINDVANRIKFAPKQIEWLEADDFIRLPEATFVRGFIRSYARLLNLETTSLLSKLPATHVQSTSRQEVQSVDIPLPSKLSVHRYNIIWLAAALLVALSLAIFERMHSRSPEQDAPIAKTTVQELDLPVGSTEDKPVELSMNVRDEGKSEHKKNVRSEPESIPAQPQKSVRSAQAQETRQITPQLSQQAISQSASQTAPQAEAQQHPRKSDQIASELPLKPVVSKPVARTVPVAAENSGKTAITDEHPNTNAEISATEHALRLEFEEDAWLEIKDGSDKVLISRMHTAGSLVRVTGTSPLLVVVGNARAVRLFDNGKKINLERYTTGDVARVKLK